MLPAAWRSLGARIEVYKYTALNEGPNRGPATVYVCDFAPLAAVGIAPPDAERDSRSGLSEQRAPHGQSQPLDDGRHRLVVYYEAEAHARRMKSAGAPISGAQSNIRTGCWKSSLRASA